MDKRMRTILQSFPSSGFPDAFFNMAAEAMAPLVARLKELGISTTIKEHEQVFNMETLAAE